jgi:hypothetical protein
MKLVWLLSVPVIALVALFAVRSAPTFAVPACAESCATTADQTIGNGYAQNVFYQQVAGQYCSDKTGGQIFVPTGAPIDPGLKCPATSGASTSAATPAPTTAATAAATSTATRAATSAATSAAGTATATATARP